MGLLHDRMVDPHHHGPLEGATGVGAVGNPACGDVLTMYIRAPAGAVEAAQFESMGSAYQLATASVLCDCIQGQTLDELKTRKHTCITDRLPDLPENKQYLARLAIEALMRAVEDHDRRAAGEGPVEPTVASEPEAESYVLAMLANGREWGTADLDAMAKADGLVWPTTLARFLAELRARGAINGEIRGTSWRWWSNDAATGLGQSGDQEPSDDGESSGDAEP